MNWKNHKNDYERLDELPKRQTVHRSHHNYWKYRYPRVGNKKSISPWNLVDKIIDKYENKPVNDAYSKFCTYFKGDLDISVKKTFFNSFDTIHYKWYNRKSHYIDSDGIIRGKVRKPKVQSPYIIYKQEVITKKITYSEYLSNKKCDPMNWKYDFNSRIASKYIMVEDKVFPSKSHYTYKRYWGELIKAKRKSKRLERIAKMEKQYSFISEKEKREKQENLTKIIKHGFDPMTSFRKEKKVNL